MLSGPQAGKQAPCLHEFSRDRSPWNPPHTHDCWSILCFNRHQSQSCTPSGSSSSNVSPLCLGMPGWANHQFGHTNRKRFSTPHSHLPWNRALPHHSCRVFALLLCIPPWTSIVIKLRLFPILKNIACVSLIRKAEIFHRRLIR